MTDPALIEALLDRGDESEAIDLLRAMIATAPDDDASRLRLGTLLMARGDAAGAEEILTPLAIRRPTDPEVAFQLGGALAKRNKLREAGAVLEAAVERGANRVDFLILLARVCFQLAMMSPCLRCLERARGLAPRNIDVLSDLAHAYVFESRLIDAAEACGRIIELDPGNMAAYSLLCWLTNHLPVWTAEEGARVHRAWAVVMADRVRRIGLSPYAPPPRPATRTRLRVGYVSPDFRGHPVAQFLEPVIELRDRERFEVRLYSDVRDPDATTERFRALADHWVDISNLDHPAATERMRADDLDILVDLAGHTTFNRLTCFALRAAPIQVTWLGYPNTTGLSEIDYRITDAIADPAPAADALHSERLHRLDGGFLAYRPNARSPAPGGPPARARGPVTFGSFNNISKLNDSVLILWARLLAAVPNARLFLKSPRLDDPGTAERLRRRFAMAGGDAERLDLLAGRQSAFDHLAAYNGMDIALDPFPYNGTTTSFDALWMGVPFVTLRGDRHAGRVGASILSGIGLPELIAETDEDYLEIAAGLAGDVDRLDRLHGEIRGRLEASPFRDEAGFTAKLEAAYAEMATRSREHFHNE